MAAALDLIDVGGGNVGSVQRCLEMLGVEFKRCGLDSPPSGDRPVVLPGVGAFGAVMASLANAGFDSLIKNLVLAGTPYLGICVGMQILFDSSQEADGVPGLGLVSGKICRFQEGKVPQIGWNAIALNLHKEALDQSRSRAEIYPESGYVYFVNSYYALPDESSKVLYYADYYTRFCAAVSCKNITGFQFHPEKSGSFGKELLRGWLANV